MSCIKTGLREYGRSIGLNSFIALELAVVIVAANLVLGYYNNIAMLYTPFKEILGGRGFYFTYDEIKLSYLSEQEGDRQTDPIKETRRRTDEALDKMKGEKRVIREYSYSLPGESFETLILDDEVFDGLRLPLSAGSYDKGKAVVSFKSGYGVGDRIELERGSIEVSGVLTEVSYCPSMNGYYYRQSDKDFYESYEAGITDSEFAIICESTAEGLILHRAPHAYSFVVFDGVSDKDYEYNKSIADNEFIYKTTEKINERSLDAINSRCGKFMPLIYITTMCAIIGIISYSIISALRAKRSGDIYYSCGATAAQCFAVTLTKGCVIFICAAAGAGAIYALLSAIGLPQLWGIRLMENNIYCTLILTAGAAVVYASVSAAVFLRLRRKVK